MNTVDEFVDAGCVSALAEEIVFFPDLGPGQRNKFLIKCCVLCFILGTPSDEHC